MYDVKYKENILERSEKSQIDQDPKKYPFNAEIFLYNSLPCRSKFFFSKKMS